MKSHEWKPTPQLGGGSWQSSIWVRCDNCNSEVVAPRSRDIKLSHIGWLMPQDCNETIIERIMTE